MQASLFLKDGIDFSYLKIDLKDICCSSFCQRELLMMFCQVILVPFKGISIFELICQSIAKCLWIINLRSVDSAQITNSSLKMFYLMLVCFSHLCSYLCNKRTQN